MFDVLHRGFEEDDDVVEVHYARMSLEPLKNDATGALKCGGVVAKPEMIMPVPIGVQVAREHRLVLIAWPNDNFPVFPDGVKGGEH